MAVVEGGSKMNVIAYWRAEDTAGVGFGKNYWLAQTFTLDDLYTTFRYEFKKCDDHAVTPHYFSLRNTLWDGTPFSTDISGAGRSPSTKKIYCPGKWCYFDMPGFPAIGPGLYALVAAAPWATSNWTNKLRCSEPPFLYPDGKAWISYDSGLTWELIPNKSFLFAAWGYQPPPEAPPPPAISNWTTFKIEYFQLTDGYRIIVTTNITCHLYFRWTNVHPEQHKIPRYRRGIYLYDDKRFCFVAWHENEQEEEGDTIIHTFTKRNWPVCETRWWYLVGTKQAAQQPSTSAIFSKHFAGEGYLLAFREPWTSL